jgi:hypothetical protein
LDKALSKKIWLDYRLDCVWFFADGHSQGGKTDRFTLKLND